jgi:hypothetical protein
MTKSTLPKKTFAKKIVSMSGWSRESSIVEIASYDGVTEKEAARRHDLALAQKFNRSMAQRNRYRATRDAIALAKDLVLIIASQQYYFTLPKDLVEVSIKAGWGASMGFDSTGRVYREFVMPMEREGLLAEKRDDEDRLIGYTITESGRAIVASWNLEG